MQAAHNFDIRQAGIEGLKAYSLAMKAAGHIEHEDPLVNSLVGELRLLTKEVKSELDLVKTERIRLQAIRDEVVAGELRPKARFTLAEVAASVADAHGLTVDDLRSRRHARPLAIARHEAFYLAYLHTLHSLPSIGRYFDRDHTTVLYGIRRHRDRMRCQA